MNKALDKIRVSVIIPAYNREETINSCINSIITQTHLPEEIIIIDDGSSDNTINEIKKINSPLIKVISTEKNNGAQHARNIGIRNAKSEWIAFLDSDDTWVNNKLEKQVKLIEENSRNPFVILNSNCYRFYERNKKKELWKLGFKKIEENGFYKYLLITPGPMFQGMIASKIALEKIGYLDESIVSYQEWDTSIRLAKFCKFNWSEEPLFTYNIGINETIFQNKSIWAKGYLSVIRKNSSEIIKHHGKKKLSQLNYNFIKQIIFWGEKKLAYSSFSSQKDFMFFIQKLHIKFLILIRK